MPYLVINSTYCVLLSEFGKRVSPDPRVEIKNKISLCLVLGQDVQPVETCMSATVTDYIFPPRWHMLTGHSHAWLHTLPREYESWSTTQKNNNRTPSSYSFGFEGKNWQWKSPAAKAFQFQSTCCQKRLWTSPLHCGKTINQIPSTDIQQRSQSLATKLPVGHLMKDYPALG